MFTLDNPNARKFASSVKSLQQCSPSIQSIILSYLQLSTLEMLMPSQGRSQFRRSISSGSKDHLELENMQKTAVFPTSYHTGMVSWSTSSQTQNSSNQISKTLEHNISVITKMMLADRFTQLPSQREWKAIRHHD